VKGSYKACLAGVERLLDAGIRVRLKTILMAVNQHEFAEMKEMARQYGVRFRLDAGISPRISGIVFRSN